MRGVFCVWFVLPRCGVCSFGALRPPPFPRLCLRGRVPSVVGAPSPPAPSGVGCRLRRVPFRVCFGVVFFSLFPCFSRFFLVSLCFLWFFPVVASPFPSASSVVSAFGFSAVFGWFALCVQRVPPAPSFRFSERVAAACPRFASWLVGHLGCSWFVAWGVASLCAARVGVVVGSGGVPVGGVQFSLFS